MLENLRLHKDVSCGLSISTLTREDTLAISREAERAGFESIWVGDHVSFHVPILESLTKLAFISGATSRVKIGTSVYLLALRNPTIAAKMTASLDVLSGGRFMLGVGVGGEFPPEWDACAVPVAERGPRTDESIRVLRRLWAEDQVTIEGRFFNFGPVSIDPKPLRKGGPPILIGGRKGPTFRRAGELGDGYISHMCTPAQFSGNLQLIDNEAGRFGRKSLDFDTTAYLFTYPGATFESALDRATAELERIYQRPFRDAARRYTLLGRPEDMLEQMQGFVAAGVRRFIFSVTIDIAEFVDMFRTEIQPRLGQLMI
jgi:probable F420-dependent oxidoreductase